MNGNVHPELLRQGLPQATMLSMSTPFMQNMPQSAQSQLSSAHLGLPPSSNPSNPPMMLNNAPGSMNSTHQQRYPVPMQQGGDSRQQRPMQMRPGQPGPQMMGPVGGPMPGGAGGPHMVNMTHGQATMGYGSNLIGQPSGNTTVRRVSSQPSMNQVPIGMAGMSPGVVGNNMGMGMPPQGNMSQMRQMPQGMQPQHRMQGQGHTSNQMNQDMTMLMNRQGGNPGMPGRAGSAQPQPMNSLPQPPSIQHPMAPHQNQFQNPTQVPSQLPPQISSPRPGSHPPSHTPSMNMATPGPSHTPVNRPPQMNTEEPMSFLNYSNSQYPQPQHPSRMQPTTNGQYPFVPSSTPPTMAEMPQPMSASLGTPGGTASRTSFHLTPAQQFEQMNTSSENFPHFNNMPPPSHVPPRPPSQLNPHALSQPPQLSHHSPHPSDSHMAPHSHPQRPQSQPQVIPRPLSQPVHTPRSAHPSLPPSGPALSQNRMSMPNIGPQGGPQVHIGGPMQGQGHVPHHLSIAPRPPVQAPTGPAPPNVPPLTQGPSDTPPSTAASIPRQSIPPSSQIGYGQGLVRLLQFSAVLAAENKTKKLQLSWWSDLIREYFTPKAMLKFTLWKDNQRNEAKPFEIGVPILPRFFLVTTQSGVKSMTFSLDGARERMYGPGHSIVECVTAIWTYKFNNGYTVTLRGPLTVHVVVTAISGAAPPPPPSQLQQGQNGNQNQPNVQLKFEDFQFDANYHDKYIALEAITGPRTMGSPRTPRTRNASTPMSNGVSVVNQQQLEEDRRWEEPRVTIESATIPGEPVNAFGIPQATMRCLELAESVSAMTDLISYSTEQSLGPLDALTQYAIKLREMHAFNPPPPILNNGHHNGPPPGPFTPIHSNSNNMPSTPSSVTLYSSAPPSVTNPSGNTAPTPTGSTVSPKNAPPSANNSPQKQHKTIPQQTPGASSSNPTAASPAVSSGGTHNTPAMANASLKRGRGTEAASPTTATAETVPPTKRQMRRRRTTNATGGTGGG